MKNTKIRLILQQNFAVTSAQAVLFLFYAAAQPAFKPMPEKNKGNTMLGLGIIAFLGTLIYNQFIYRYERYYLGEELTGKNIIIKEKPEYIDEESSDGTSHYSFTAAGMSCRFWLSEGSLDVIRNNKMVQQTIEAIRPGDSVTIRVRSMELEYLNQDNQVVRVIGMSLYGQLLLTPEEVERYDRKHYGINIGAGILFLLIGIGAKIAGSRKKEDKMPDIRDTENFIT